MWSGLWHWAPREVAKQRRAPKVYHIMCAVVYAVYAYVRTVWMFLFHIIHTYDKRMSRYLPSCILNEARKDGQSGVGVSSVRCRSLRKLKPSRKNASISPCFFPRSDPRNNCAAFPPAEPLSVSHTAPSLLTSHYGMLGTE